MPKSPSPKKAGAPKVKGAVHAKSGCTYTCRISNRNCNERPDRFVPCEICFRLHLQCLGFGATRPDWLRENNNMVELREKIKQFHTSQGYSAEQEQLADDHSRNSNDRNTWPEDENTDLRRDTEQHSRRRNSNDHDTWPGDENTDNRDTADNPPSSSTGTESPISSSRDVHTVNGRYTEQDNRGIDHNIETCGTYHEGDHINIHEGDYYNGDWKTVVATGGVVTTAFYAGHTAQLHGSYNHNAQLHLPTNNAIIIFPQYSFDQVPSLVVNYLFLPMMLMKMFFLVRQSFPTVFTS